MLITVQVDSLHNPEGVVIGLLYTTIDKISPDEKKRIEGILITDAQGNYTGTTTGIFSEVNQNIAQIIVLFDRNIKPIFTTSHKIKVEV